VQCAQNGNTLKVVMSHAMFDKTLLISCLKSIHQIKSEKPESVDKLYKAHH